MKAISDILRAPAAPALALGAALLGALLLQHLLGWQPCPLCILQRLSAIALFLGLLAYAFTSGLARSIALGVSGLACGAGLVFAGLQLWLLYTPATETCGPGLALTISQLVDSLPGSAWLLEGAGACEDARYNILGLPLAAWSAAAHVFALGWAVKSAD